MPHKIISGQTTGVKLSPYYMNSINVTKDLYYLIMNDNPNGLIVTQPTDLEKNEPIECEFIAACTFCNRLSKKMGLTPVYSMICKDSTTYNNSPYIYYIEEDPDKWDFNFMLTTNTSSYYIMYVYCDTTADGFRLPTDTEYQYAMGSGYYANGTDYYWKDSNNNTYDISDIGWTSETSVNTPQNVAQKIPNEYGLHDMSGNVSEWTNDFTAFIDAQTMWTNISDDTVNFAAPPNLITGLVKYAKNGYYNAPSTLYTCLEYAKQRASTRVSDGGDYTQDESYAVPYSSTRYSENNKTRYSSNDTLSSNGNGTYSGTVKRGFRIVKNEPMYLLDKYEGEYKFIMPGSSNFEPIPLRRIDGGYFLQGAQASDITMPNYDQYAQSNESPVHKVLLTDFYIGIEKIPVNLWLCVMAKNKNLYGNLVYSSLSYMNNNDSYNPFTIGRIYNDANFCMYNMLKAKAKPTWRRAMVFCNRLSRLLGLEPVYHLNGEYDETKWNQTTTGNYRYCDFGFQQTARTAVDCICVDKTKHGFRLPSESEFEYAAKGGIFKDTFIYPGTNDPVECGAKITDTNKKTNQQYYNFIPNSLGLYDMCATVSEMLQDTTDSTTNNPKYLYSDTTHYPQPRTGEDFLINPIVEADYDGYMASGTSNPWYYTHARCNGGKSLNTSQAWSYYSTASGRCTSRTFGYSNNNYGGAYKYGANYIENFRLVLQSPQVLPEDLPSTKVTLFSDLKLDYKQEKTNPYTYLLRQNFKFANSKASFNMIKVPLCPKTQVYNSNNYNQTIKKVDDNQFINYNNTLNTGTTYSVAMYHGYNPSYYCVYDIYVSEIPLTMEVYQLLFPNDEANILNNNYSNSNNDPASYRQYLNITWYKALEICNRLSILFGLNPIYKINNSTNPNQWTSIPTDAESAANSLWNTPEINNYSDPIVNNNNYYFRYNGFRLPTCIEMLYLAFHKLDTTVATGNQFNIVDDDCLYPGSNEISDVSCFKIIDTINQTEVTDYTQVTNLTDFKFESMDNLDYPNGYSKVKMYKPNGFGIYDLATCCCPCFDYWTNEDPTDTSVYPYSSGFVVAPSYTDGIRNCCAFGMKSGVNLGDLAENSMRKFVPIQPYESYPWMSLRLVRSQWCYWTDSVDKSRTDIFRRRYN